MLITAVITDAVKDAVGRPRPDFFWRCFPDGKEVCCALHVFIFSVYSILLILCPIDFCLPQLYDRFGGVICHGKDSDIREGHKSFPSGHTSCKQLFLLYHIHEYIEL